jgi:hypothetical protein
VLLAEVRGDHDEVTALAQVGDRLGSLSAGLGASRRQHQHLESGG